VGTFVGDIGQRKYRFRHRFGEAAFASRTVRPPTNRIVQRKYGNQPDQHAASAEHRDYVWKYEQRQNDHHRNYGGSAFDVFPNRHWLPSSRPSAGEARA